MPLVEEDVLHHQPAPSAVVVRRVLRPNLVYMVPKADLPSPHLDHCCILRLIGAPELP